MNVGFNLVPAMLSGKVAATLGGYWNYEAIQLQLMHKHPIVIPIDQAGVPGYDELVLVVREDEARERGQDLRAFLQALTRGERAGPREPPRRRRRWSSRRTLRWKRSCSWNRSARRCRRRTGERERSLRLAGTIGMGELRTLDARARTDPTQPERRAAAVHERVPTGPGDLAGRFAHGCAEARCATGLAERDGALGQCADIRIEPR